MRQTNNLGLALYDTTDKMNITGSESSLNHNMEILDQCLHAMDDQIAANEEKIGEKVTQEQLTNAVRLAKEGTVSHQNAQELTQEQKQQARQNIGAADGEATEESLGAVRKWIYDNSEVEFVFGHLSADSSVTSNYQKNICFKEKIFARKGARIYVDEGYKYQISRYKVEDHTAIERIAWMQSDFVYVLKEDCYIRVEISDVNETVLTNLSISKHLHCEMFSDALKVFINQIKDDLGDLEDDVSKLHSDYFYDISAKVVRIETGCALCKTKTLIKNANYKTYFIAIRPKTFSIFFSILPTILTSSGEEATSYKLRTQIWDSDYNYISEDGMVVYNDYAISKPSIKNLIGSSYDASSTYVLVASFRLDEEPTIEEFAFDKISKNGLIESKIVGLPIKNKNRNLIDYREFSGPYKSSRTGELRKANGSEIGYFISNIFELDNTKRLYVNTPYNNIFKALKIRLYDADLNTVGDALGILPNENITVGKSVIHGLDIPTNYPTARYGIVFWDDLSYVHDESNLGIVYVSQNEIVDGEPKEPYCSYEPRKAKSISELNEDRYHEVLASALYGKTKGTDKRVQFIVTSDVHKDWLMQKRATEYANEIPSVRFISSLGDMADGNGYTEDAEWFTDLKTISNVDIYPIIGNHDMGNSKNVGGSDPSGTVTNITEKWIEPFVSGNTNISRPNGKPYYSRTFSTEKLVFIFLNCYDCPDENNGSEYTISRGMPCWGQDQIDWFISQLNSVPSGYGVVISIHQWGDELNIENNEWNDSQSAFVKAQTFPNLLPDIVNAWINGASLNETYLGVDIDRNPINVGGARYQISVNANFSARGNGVFVSYLVGHAHRDTIANCKKYDNQKIIFFATTSSNDSQNMGDLSRVMWTKSMDAITIVTVSMYRRQIYLQRIGADISSTMIDRSRIAITF